MDYAWGSDADEKSVEFDWRSALAELGQSEQSVGLEAQAETDPDASPRPARLETVRPDTKPLDSQQTELVGRALLEAELVRQGFEVARPIRDNRVDLLVFLLQEGRASAIPIQVKVKTDDGFDVDRKYDQVKGLVLAYVWHIHGAPRFFLLTYQDALKVMGEKALASKTWRDRGYYNTSRVGTDKLLLLERFEDRWSWLRERLEQDAGR